MICFKNEHKSDQETYVALTRAFFTSLSPVRAALNYILAALLLAFGIYNLTAGETAWGIVMTACGLLLIALTLLYPWLMGRSVEKYAAGYEPFDMWVEFRTTASAARTARTTTRTATSRPSRRATAISSCSSRAAMPCCGMALHRRGRSGIRRVHRGKRAG